MTQINYDLYDSDPFDMKKSKFGPFKDNRPLIDKVKEKAISEEKKYKVVFSITTNYDPFIRT